MNDLKVVIGKTDRPEGHRRKHRNPDKRIAQVRPQQRRHQDRDRDQQTTHGRRTRFFLMSLGALFADVLPDLKIAQPLNNDRSNDQAGEKGGEAGKCCTERQVTKNTEGRKIMEELQVEQPVEQSASDTSSRFPVLSSQFPVLPLCICVFPVVQAFGLYHRGHRETQGKPSSNPPATADLSSQLPPPGREVRRVFAAMSQALFPASRLATLSTIRHRLPEFRARATRRPLLASRQIPLSYPPREPLPPWASPSLARQAGNQAYFRPDFLPHFLPHFLLCTARTRDAVARRWRQAPASRRQQQSGVARASLPEYPPPPSAPSDLNCSNRTAR